MWTLLTAHVGEVKKKNTPIRPKALVASGGGVIGGAHVYIYVLTAHPDGTPQMTTTAVIRAEVVDTPPIMGRVRATLVA